MFYKGFLIILSAFLFCSCSKKDLDNGLVFIRHKKADMPLWAKGNLSSDIFIIYIHGGPGGSSFIDIHNDFFAQIENKYCMVYYDQRASGNSIGKSDNSLLTLKQFVEDLDIIIKYVKQTYQPSKIVLMGHSWGGTLGTAYLLNESYQEHIAGWIEVDGGHNLGLGAYQYSRDYVLNIADSLIDNKSDIQKWRKIKSYYQGIDTWRNPEVIIQHSKNVTDAGGYFYNPNNRKGLVGGEKILFSETDFLALLSQNKQVIKNMDVWHYDFTNRLSEITIPTLLLWGKTDGILPVQLAYEANSVLNLEDDQFYIFEKSGHSPHYEETILFNQKVLSFIEKYVE